MEISLHPLEEDDLPILVSWTSSREFLMQWAGPSFSYPLTVGQLAEHLAGCRADPPLRRMLKAVECDGGMIGHAEIDAINEQAGTATVSRVIVGRPRSRGAGLGTTIMRMIVRLAFDEMGLQELDLHVFDFNARALSCYRKVGFTVESHIPNARRVGDSYWGLYRMVLSR